MKVYELEEKEEGVLAVSGEERPKAKRGTVKKVLAACAAALGVVFEAVMGIPVYMVIAVVALFTLPAALISRSKRRAEERAR